MRHGNKPRDDTISKLAQASFLLHYCLKFFFILAPTDNIYCPIHICVISQYGLIKKATQRYIGQIHLACLVLSASEYFNIITFKHFELPWCMKDAIKLPCLFPLSCFFTGGMEQLVSYFVLLQAEKNRPASL